MESIACNIGTKGQKRRERIGMLFLVLAGFGSAIVITLDVSTVFRVVVFPFFFIGFVSLLEAARKVCVRNAHQKTIEMD